MHPKDPLPLRQAQRKAVRSKPRATTPAPALGQEKEDTPPISKQHPRAMTPAPALGQKEEETRPSSEPWPGAATPAPALG